MPDLGSFTETDIAAIANEVRFPKRAGASPTDRFISQISDLVALRLAAGEDEGISIFLRSDALASDVAGRGYEVIPFIRHGKASISKRIVLANASLGAAYSLPNGPEQSDPVKLVCDAGLGALPALVIDWSGDRPKALLYGSGLGNPDDVHDVYLTETNITPENLKEALDDFYRKRLRTPALVSQGHSTPIWSDAAKGWPAHKPEERIQGVLMNYLLARYSRFEVRAEVPNEDGRLDILIFAKLFNGSGRKLVDKVWVLELKALTDHTSTGGSVPTSAVTEAITKGLKQAVSYKEADHVNQAALCCFDMRGTDLGDTAVFGHIAAEANDNEVHLWRWYMHRSSSAGRDAKWEERKSASPGAG